METSSSKAQEISTAGIKKTIHIEVWSDVVCPFCYIGKRKLEKALEDLDEQVEIRLEWKSFLLNPSLKSDSSKTIYQHLAENKGWSEKYAKEVSQHVTQMAEKEGLHYNFDKVVVASSRKAHRLIQFAKNKGKGTEAEELLFEAYFILGKNIDDQKTLEQLGQKLGFTSEDLKSLSEDESLNSALQKDLQEAEELGIGGVPYFIFNRKVAVSGAQDSKVFKTALERVIK